MHEQSQERIGHSVTGGKSEQDVENEQLESALQRCASGDRDAFKIIYVISSGKFSAIISEMVKDDDVMRDVLQKGYLSIWKNAAKFDRTKGKPFTWMLVIMRNRAIDVLRSNARIRPSEVLEETLVDLAPRPESTAQMNHLRDVLQTHMNDLPGLTGKAIWMNVVEGWTCKEIGQQLDVAPNTVKSWVRRGLQKLNADLPFETLDYAI